MKQFNCILIARKIDHAKYKIRNPISEYKITQLMDPPPFPRTENSLPLHTGLWVKLPRTWTNSQGILSIFGGG